nr:heme-binding protein [Rhizobium sp. 18065]
MPNTFESLNLLDAKNIVEASLARANALKIACSVAVVDAGGFLLAFARQDDAMVGSVELAINKAYTALIFRNSTEAVGKLAQPAAELYGIEHSHAGKVVIFGGGIPVLLNGTVIGAIGVSGGSVAQDIDVASASQFTSIQHQVGAK